MVSGKSNQSVIRQTIAGGFLAGVLDGENCEVMKIALFHRHWRVSDYNDLRIESAKRWG